MTTTNQLGAKMLTDEQRRDMAKAIVETYLGFPAPDREPGNLDLKAVDAAFAVLLSASKPAAPADHSECCDAAAYCSSVRRCTAKDAAAPAQSGEAVSGEWTKWRHANTAIRERYKDCPDVQFRPMFLGQSSDREIVRELQKALFYWMPSIAGEDSPAGQKAAEHAYLLTGLDDNSTECWGDQIMASLGIRNRALEQIEAVLQDLGCPENMEMADFLTTLMPAVALDDERAAWDGDSENSRAGFRSFDERHVARWATPWHVWMAACAWQARAASPQATDWRDICATMIDIYDDGMNNAPEDRCYVEGAWKEELDKVRALLKMGKN